MAGSRAPGSEGLDRRALDRNRAHPEAASALPASVGLQPALDGGEFQTRGARGQRTVLGSSHAVRGRRWLAVPLVLPSGENTDPVRVGPIRIDHGDAPHAPDERLPIGTPEEAETIAAQLAAFPDSESQLLDLRDDGRRLGLAVWAARALLAGELKILVQSQGGVPGAAKIPAAPSPAPRRGSGSAPSSFKKPEELHWIEILVTAENGTPLPDVGYVIVTADKQRYSGTTDKTGLVRLDNIVGGPCGISFPDIGDEEWKKA